MGFTGLTPFMSNVFVKREKQTAGLSWVYPKIVNSGDGKLARDPSLNAHRQLLERREFAGVGPVMGVKVLVQSMEIPSLKPVTGAFSAHCGPWCKVRSQRQYTHVHSSMVLTAEQHSQPHSTHVLLLSCCSRDSAAFSAMLFLLTLKMSLSSTGPAQICISMPRPARIPARHGVVRQLVMVRSIFWTR